MANHRCQLCKSTNSVKQCAVTIAWSEHGEAFVLRHGILLGRLDRPIAEVFRKGRRMGTTYQAQVEVFFESQDCWQEVSRWEFQKDYAFSIAWSEVAERGWPNDVCLIGDDLPDAKYGYDLDLKRWGSGELFASLEPTDCFAWFIEAREHVKRLLTQQYKVRVLTWGE
jgi:hypothetical protein